MVVIVGETNVTTQKLTIYYSFVPKVSLSHLSQNTASEQSDHQIRRKLNLEISYHLAYEAIRSKQAQQLELLLSCVDFC